MSIEGWLLSWSPRRGVLGGGGRAGKAGGGGGEGTGRRRGAFSFNHAGQSPVQYCYCGAGERGGGCGVN